MNSWMLLVAAAAAVTAVLVWRHQRRNRRLLFGFPRASVPGRSVAPAEAERAIRESEFSAAADRLISLVRPAVLVDARPVAFAHLLPGASRFGGRPDLPAGFQWPTYYMRTPLSFLAQINLADVSPLDKEGLLPTAGWLCFFYDAKGQQGGYDPKHAGAFQVMYFDGPAENLTRAPLPEGIGRDFHFTPCAITFRPSMMLPDFCEEIDKGFDEATVDSEAYAELCDQVCGHPQDRVASHHLLGYPRNIQSSDMRVMCQLVTNGLNCGDLSGYRDARAQPLRAGANDWILLLQIDSDDSPGWMWGDAGRLYIWIRRQDLAARSFDKVWAILECY